MKDPVKIKRSNIYGVAIQYDGTVESANACGLIEINDSQVRGYRLDESHFVVIEPGMWKVALSGPWEPPRWVSQSQFALEFEQVEAFFGEEVLTCAGDTAHQHDCDKRPAFSPRSPNMEAFDEVWLNPDGTMEIGNGEYGSFVNFCPWCGKKAAKQL